MKIKRTDAGVEVELSQADVLESMSQYISRLITERMDDLADKGIVERDVAYVMPKLSVQYMPDGTILAVGGLMVRKEGAKANG